MTKPTLIVIGGGAGGLPLVTLLGRKLGRTRQADVVLVDGNVSHIWRPRFHEVATGAIDANLDAVEQRVFAIGDCASCIPEGAERPVPPHPQSAQQMAHHLARELVRLIRRGREPRVFHYHDRGSLVSLSRFTSVGMLMGNLTGGSFFIEGGLARLMYISLYRMHQATLYGWPKTLLLMLVGKFSRMVRPRLKLH